MSLTVALAILGGLVLAAIVAHSTWQSRKASPRRARGEPMDPALRREPTMGPTDVQPETSVVGTLPDGAADVPRNDGVDIPAILRRQVRLDASIDAIAPVALETPVTGELALMHMPTARRAGSKPFYIEGLNAATGEWETPTEGQHYGEFQAGVQLANRNGPLNEIEYSEFVQKVQAFSDPIGGRVDAPDMLGVVGRARELDAFAQSSDAVLTAELVTQGAAWSTGYVQQCAANHGFIPGALPGRLILSGSIAPGAADRGEPPMLMINFDPQAALADDPTQAVVRTITLTLDVPQTSEAAGPFATWQRVASDLAQTLDASLVDHDGRAIAPSSFEAIGQQLSQLYQRMAAHDLAAGSPAARRLFS